MTGQPTTGRPLNLAQLQSELQATSVDVGLGLGMSESLVYRFVDDGQRTGGGQVLGTAADFLSDQQAAVDQAIEAHVGMRDKTDAEYAAEFQATGTTAARKQEIRDITAGLLPREQVPM